MKPSLTRFTAPFRGTTSSEDIINFFQEILHEIRSLMFWMDTNEVINKPGQSDYINDNLQYLMYGSGGGNILHSVPKIGELYNESTLLGTRFIELINSGESNQVSIKGRINSIEDAAECINKNIV